MISQPICYVNEANGEHHPSVKGAQNFSNAVMDDQIALTQKRLAEATGDSAGAIRKELDEVFVLSCSYTFGPMGATNVTIK